MSLLSSLKDGETSSQDLLASTMSPGFPTLRAYFFKISTFFLQFVVLTTIYLSNRYIFGKNSKTEKIPMTTPVFTEASESNPSSVSIQVVLPLDKDMKRSNLYSNSALTCCSQANILIGIFVASLPDPEKDTINLRRVEGGTAAVLKFSGKPTDDAVWQKEKLLRSSLVKDGLRPRNGCLLARYNDPGRTKSFVMVCPSFVLFCSFFFPSVLPRMVCPSLVLFVIIISYRIRRLCFLFFLFLAIALEPYSIDQLVNVVEVPL